MEITYRSFVMQYGDQSFSNDFLVTYMGADPTHINNSYILSSNANAYSYAPQATPTRLVSQQDALLIHHRHKVGFGWILFI